MTLYNEAERLFRQLSDLDGLQTILGVQAGILPEAWRPGWGHESVQRKRMPVPAIGRNLDGLQSSLGSLKGGY